IIASSIESRARPPRYNEGRGAVCEVVHPRRRFAANTGRGARRDGGCTPPRAPPGCAARICDDLDARPGAGVMCARQKRERAMSGENCLAGMKVLDLTQFEAGPSCSEALAWMGADVVKIENPGAGDPGRNIGRTAADKDALYFLQYNSNKRSAAVNLKDPRGLDLVKRLARQADVMMENFAPGAIERLGLGYDVIKAINPGIIYCQVKGFGKGSPFEKNLAFDMIAQATGGTMSVTGEENGPPCRPGATI